jgi:hypothetical protein
MTAIRRFKCNTHVTLPSGMTPIDGQPNMRFEPGQTFDVDAAKCQTQQRYVFGRLRAKDFEEVDYVPEPKPEVTVTAVSTSEPATAAASSSPAPADATPKLDVIAPDPAPVPATAPDHTPITASSPPPKASDPAFTFTAQLPKKEG